MIQKSVRAELLFYKLWSYQLAQCYKTHVHAELFEGEGRKDKKENMERSLKERKTEVWCKTHKV